MTEWNRVAWTLLRFFFKKGRDLRAVSLYIQIALQEHSLQGGLREVVGLGRGEAHFLLHALLYSYGPRLCITSKVKKLKYIAY